MMIPLIKPPIKPLIKGSVLMPCVVEGVGRGSHLEAGSEENS